MNANCMMKEIDFPTWTQQIVKFTPFQISVELGMGLLSICKRQKIIFHQSSLMPVPLTL